MTALNFSSFEDDRVLGLTSLVEVVTFVTKLGVDVDKTVLLSILSVVDEIEEVFVIDVVSHCVVLANW